MASPFTKNIRANLLFFTAATIILLGFILTVTSNSQHTKTLTEELDSRGRIIAKMLAENSILALALQDQEILNNLVTATAKENDINMVQIKDPYNKTLVRATNPSKSETESETEKDVINIQMPITPPKSGEGFDYLADIIETGKIDETSDGQDKSGRASLIGYVEIVMSRNHIKNAIAANKARNFVFTTIMVATSILLAFYAITISLSRPINALIAGMRKIAGGNLDFKIEGLPDNEIGTMGETFNNMTGELKTYRDALERYSRTLEDKVNERTEELRESYEKLKAAQTRLVQADKMAAVGQLAAGVAHEINNPLSVILGFAQSAVRRIKNEDTLYQPLHAIERESLRCRAIVQSLLTFSRRSKGAKEKLNISELVETCLNLITAQARVNNVEIASKFDDELPLIFADPNQVQQVVINLCNNAIDAMPQGGTLTVSLTKNNSRYIDMSVADTGTGIPQEFIHKIFEPFFTTKDPGKGTGLGLSLVYEIMQQHDAGVDVQSELNKGTEFKVNWPIAEV